MLMLSYLMLGDMVTVSIFYIQPMLAQCAVQNRDVLDEQPKTPQQICKCVSTTFTSSSEGGKKRRGVQTWCWHGVPNEMSD